MYNLSVRPHLVYGDIDSRKYEAAFAVSGAWKGTNTDRLLGELGWVILINREWYRRICYIIK